jgi:hypothetical protein
MICEAIAKRMPPIMMGFTIPAQEFFIILPRITDCLQGIINMQWLGGENEWQEQDQERCIRMGG